MSLAKSERLVSVCRSLVEGKAICTDDRIVNLRDANLKYSVDFKTEADGSLTDEDDLAELIKLRNQDLVPRVEPRLEVS